LKELGARSSMALGSQTLMLYLFAPPTWLLFCHYGESIEASYVTDLYHCSTLCQMIPKSPLCHAYVQGKS
jgi:hypothetical protein